MLILCGWSLSAAVNLVAYHGHRDAHERADDVEEAVWQVGEGRHAQNRRLGHAAAAPWKKRGSHCG